MIPPDQTPRDALANVIQELRGRAAADAFRVTGTDVIRWERRLTAALRNMDTETSLHSNVRVCAAELINELAPRYNAPSVNDRIADLRDALEKTGRYDVQRT